MSIGQRIAQKRKEQGLSQEALGERLGVSRQSIYKWESEAALPEIEKLVALSRLFGVSVGWLLGVEEGVPAESAAPEASPAAGGELTEAQLNMVEEIVGRYIAAQPAPRPVSPRRRRSLRLSAVAAAVCLVLALFSLFRRLDRVDRQYIALQDSVNSVTQSVNSQIGGISDRVEELLKAQNHLTADYSSELLSADYAAGTATFYAYAMPRLYAAGIQAVFIADSGSGPVKFPGQAAEQDGRFYAEITAELTDSITLSVVFTYPDGTGGTQLLDTYEGLYSASLPAVEIGDGLMWKELSGDGVLTLSQLDHSCYVHTRSAEKDGAASAAEVRVGLFKNRKLAAWAAPCQQPPGFQGFEDRSFYLLPGIQLALTPEDQIQTAAVITDEYGRTTVSPGGSYRIDEDGSQLTLVSYSSLSSDPADWQFD